MDDGDCGVDVNDGRVWTAAVRRGQQQRRPPQLGFARSFVNRDWGKER